MGRRLPPPLRGLHSHQDLRMEGVRMHVVSRCCKPSAEKSSVLTVTFTGLAKAAPETATQTVTNPVISSATYKGCSTAAVRTIFVWRVNYKWFHSKAVANTIFLIENSDYGYRRLSHLDSFIRLVWGNDERETFRIFN